MVFNDFKMNFNDFHSCSFSSDGGWLRWMVDGGWWMVDGRWWMVEDCGLWMVDCGLRIVFHGFTMVFIDLHSFVWWMVDVFHGFSMDGGWCS